MDLKSQVVCCRASLCARRLYSCEGVGGQTDWRITCQEDGLGGGLRLFQDPIRPRPRASAATWLHLGPLSHPTGGGLTPSASAQSNTSAALLQSQAALWDRDRKQSVHPDPLSFSLSAVNIGHSIELLALGQITPLYPSFHSSCPLLAFTF